MPKPCRFSFAVLAVLFLAFPVVRAQQAAPDAPKAERNYANKKRPSYSKPRDHSGAGKPRENNGGQRRDGAGAGKPRSNSRPRRQASV